jgi:cell cycle arrest protein BUB3
MEEIRISAPPGDGISKVIFSPIQSELLLVSSWDSSARLYDVLQNIPKSTHAFDGAVLTCEFDASGTHAYAGGLDQSVYSIDLSRGTKTILGGHNDAVSCMKTSIESNLLFSGSWDRSVLWFDNRNLNSKPSKIQFNSKVYALSTAGTELVVGTQSHELHIFDTRNLSQPREIRESPLKHQIRSIACDPITKSNFVVSSVEGRVALEYFDSSSNSGSQNYAFKCHRKDNIAYPVNSIAFHPVYGSFATGGCDGFVNIWDGHHRKRLSQLHAYPTSIASLSFNCGENLIVNCFFKKLSSMTVTRWKPFGCRSELYF